ncbi:hypothetical protein P872_12325 [Rhodonellum psychrophilum GCM71 = DSM 17998]|uniref:Type I restriction modification DNA specificity domain-containing protein n=2 Tax=Rhodonellum TaxID=336827 RepID=U5BXB3_9BACT|nr:MULTISPECIES: restriction endonuclease subunit S [Rhodonellum]ERM80552.1 hypothetical protein P872_12325 [Rhodonellum psychrophilum GCM71 = DSM 17998]SDZ48559.1 type I restriction enzyme, S subunit [Rhodonellum ikkaensis]
MSEKSMLPKLRFSDFKENWQEKNLEDICTLQRGFDITAKSRIHGDFPVYSSSGISYFHNQYKVKGPGIVTGRKGVLGKVFFILGPHWPHDTTLWVKNFHGNDVKFVYWLLVNFKLERFDAASSIPTLNRNNVHRIKVLVPSLPEQQKIASFLSSVDERIDLLERKKEKLEVYKKGVMQQIFSQKIRFKQDDGSEFPDWEERKLGEVGDFYGGGTPESTKEHFWKGKVPWISSSNLTDNSIFKVSKTRFISEEAIVQSATKKVPPGSVLIVTRVGVGKVAFSDESLCTSQDFASIAPNNQYNPIYLAYCLLCLRSKIINLSQGTSIKGVILEDLKSLKIPSPSKEEQKKIAAFLNSIDENLETLDRQIQGLRTWKKGLLQQMFV